MNTQKYKLTLFGENYFFSSDEPPEVMNNIISKIEAKHQEYELKNIKDSRNIILILMELAKDIIEIEDKVVHISRKI